MPGNLQESALWRRSNGGVAPSRFGMNSSKSTPMIKQYLSIKDEYPDAILLYRMGDFY